MPIVSKILKETKKQGQGEPTHAPDSIIDLPQRCKAPCWVLDENGKCRKSSNCSNEGNEFKFIY